MQLCASGSSKGGGVNPELLTFEAQVEGLILRLRSAGDRGGSRADRKIAQETSGWGLNT